MTSPLGRPARALLWRATKALGAVACLIGCASEATPAELALRSQDRTRPLTFEAGLAVPATDEVEAARGDEDADVQTSSGDAETPSSDAETPSSDADVLSSGWEPIGCTYKEPTLSASLTTTRPISAVTVYHAFDAWIIPYDATSPHPVHLPEAPAGTLCADASDREACRARVDALLLQERRRCHVPDSTVPCGPLAIAQNKDDVWLLSSAEQLRGELGTIDTSVEAVLTAAMNGVDIQCHGAFGIDDLRGTATRLRDDGGYDVLSEFQVCLGWFRKELTVAPDGTVSATVLTPLRYYNCPGGRLP